MFDANNLHYSDVQTTPIAGKDYLDHMEEENLKTQLQIQHDQYEPNREELSKISQWIANNDEKLSILAIGASWCGDCNRNIPRLIKIEEHFGEDKMKLEILSGIKTKIPSRRKPGEPIWKSPPSPPESIDPKFDVKKIPMIYIFNKEGDCLGRIVENPSVTLTLEGDIASFLQ